MRFVASVLAAGAACVSVPAEAARFWVISGGGEATREQFFCHTSCTISERKVGNVEFTFEMVLRDSDEPLTFANETGFQRQGWPIGSGVQLDYVTASGTVRGERDGNLFGNGGLLYDNRGRGFEDRIASIRMNFEMRLIESADITPSFRFTNLTAVPEPSTWAMMIAGFGLAGASLRRRALASA